MGCGQDHGSARVGDSDGGTGVGEGGTTGDNNTNGDGDSSRGGDTSGDGDSSEDRVIANGDGDSSGGTGGDGDASGGAPAVGGASGGTSSGGSSSGGASGGDSNGGASTGGSASGGASTGGAASGGTGGDEVTPAVPPVYKKIESAARQSCALTDEGKLECWGAGGATRPPKGTYSDFTLSTSGGPFDNLEFGCAVPINSGVLECWGRGLTIPLLPPDTPFTSVSAGTDESMCGIRKSDGRAECWGRLVKQDPPNVGFSSLLDAGDVCGVRNADRALSCFNRFSSVIVDYSTVPLGRYQPDTLTLVGGTAFCAAKEGEDTLKCFAFPIDNPSQALTPELLMPVGGGYRLLAGSSSHACGAAISDDTMSCWGESTWSWTANSQVYVARDTNFLSPLDGRQKQLSASASGMCGLNDSTDLVRCTGGQRSQPDNGLQFRAVETGNVTCGLLRQTGKVACVADFLGKGEARYPDEPSDSFEQLVLGDDFACGLDALGETTCWGPAYEATTPTMKFHSITAGSLTICGIKIDDSELECWNADGSHAATPPSGAFLAISGSAETDQPMAGHVDVYSGDSLVQSGASSQGDPRMCGIRADHTLQCWGCAVEDDCNVPTGTFETLDIAFDQACAVTTEGKGLCFPSTVPQPDDSRIFSKIAVGVNYACGLDEEDNGVSCWGTGTTRVPPEQETFSDVSAGFGYGCGVRKSDGKLLCWGTFERNL